MISYTSGQDGAILSTRGYLPCPAREKFSRKPNNKTFIDQAFSVKKAGYWPRSFFASLWTLTPSRCINKQLKKLVNSQPSWPHPWRLSLTEINVTEHHISNNNNNKTNNNKHKRQDFNNKKIRTFLWFSISTIMFWIIHAKPKPSV